MGNFHHTAPARTSAALLAVVGTMTSVVEARSPQTDATSGITAFTQHCFSPFLTAEKAAKAFNYPNIRYDFYDLDPFTSAAPTPAKTSATPGTDRRCEVSFESDFTTEATGPVVAKLVSEGITTPADVPTTHAETPGTAFLAARRLNPEKIAIVHIGTRQGPNGLETYLNVERLPLSEVSK